MLILGYSLKFNKKDLLFLFFLFLLGIIILFQFAFLAVLEQNATKSFVKDSSSVIIEINRQNNENYDVNWTKFFSQVQDINENLEIEYYFSFGLGNISTINGTLFSSNFPKICYGYDLNTVKTLINETNKEEEITEGAIIQKSLAEQLNVSIADLINVTLVNIYNKNESYSLSFQILKILDEFPQKFPDIVITLDSLFEKQLVNTLFFQFQLRMKYNQEFLRRITLEKLKRINNDVVSDLNSLIVENHVYPIDIRNFLTEEIDEAKQELNNYYLISTILYILTLSLLSVSSLILFEFNLKRKKRIIDSMFSRGIDYSKLTNLLVLGFSQTLIISFVIFFIVSIIIKFTFKLFSVFLLASNLFYLFIVVLFLLVNYFYTKRKVIKIFTLEPKYSHTPKQMKTKSREIIILISITVILLLFSILFSPQYGIFNFFGSIIFSRIIDIMLLGVISYFLIFHGFKIVLSLTISIVKKKYNNEAKYVISIFTNSRVIKKSFLMFICLMSLISAQLMLTESITQQKDLEQIALMGKDIVVHNQEWNISNINQLMKLSNISKFTPVLQDAGDVNGSSVQLYFIKPAILYEISPLPIKFKYFDWKETLLKLDNIETGCIISNQLHNKLKVCVNQSVFVHSILYLTDTEGMIYRYPFNQTSLVFDTFYSIPLLGIRTDSDAIVMNIDVLGSVIDMSKPDILYIKVNKGEDPKEVFANILNNAKILGFPTKDIRVTYFEDYISENEISLTDIYLNSEKVVFLYNLVTLIIFALYIILVSLSEVERKICVLLSRGTHPNNLVKYLTTPLVSIILLSEIVASIVGFIFFSSIKNLMTSAIYVDYPFPRDSIIFLSTSLIIILLIIFVIVTLNIRRKYMKINIPQYKNE
ncbi:MAG: FtsX-like permease family protein [Candidatus Heimdallarchaeaceae archaeon]